MSTERYRSPKISIPVDDVDVSLEDFDTSDLVKELKHRDALKAETQLPIQEELSEVLELLREGRPIDAAAALEKILWPKWKNHDQCEEAYAKAKSK